MLLVVTTACIPPFLLGVAGWLAHAPALPLTAAAGGLFVVLFATCTIIAIRPGRQLPPAAGFRPVIVHRHVIQDESTGINASVLPGRGYEDQWMAITRKVFAELGIPLEEQSRQVKAHSPAVLTVIAARIMVAAVARGISAVQYGAGSIPTTIDRAEIDFAKAESAATSWLGHVFGAVGATTFKDKGLVLRAVPVSAALGALGRPFYAGDLDGKLSAKAVLNSGIDWSAGPHWSGIAGKVNPNGAFSVGSGKENGYATYRALTDPDDPGYKAIRHLETAE